MHIRIRARTQKNHQPHKKKQNYEKSNFIK